jgi:hypothetical protein
MFVFRLSRMGGEKVESISDELQVFALETIIK